MADPYLFTSERLGFRLWSKADLDPLVQMNQHPDVMRHFPSKLNENESRALLDRFEKHYDTHGYSVYAVDLLTTSQWIGFIGFQLVRFDSHFTPATEIAYRLIPEAWGKGLATEGTKACLSLASNQLKIDKLVSFTTQTNLASQRVMQKSGLSYQGMFGHPNLPIGHPLHLHVLYQYLY